MTSRMTCLITAVSTLAFVSTATLAQSASRSNFQNHPVVSPFFVSPAQYYQTRGASIYGSYFMATANAELEGDPATIKLDADQSAVNLSGVFPVTPTVTGGLLFSQGKSEATTDIDLSPASTPDESTNDGDEQDVTPIMAFRATDTVAIGFAFEIHTEEADPEDGDSYDADFTRFIPGVLFHTDQLEAGVVYSPTISIRDDDGSAYETGVTLIHAQFRLTPDVAVGGQVGHIRAAAVDDDTNKDHLAFIAAAEANVGDMATVGASFEYTTESAKDEENLDPGSIPTYTLQVSAEVRPTRQMSLHASVGYLTGDKDGKYENPATGEVEDTKNSISSTAILAGGGFHF